MAVWNMDYHSAKITPRQSDTRCEVPGVNIFSGRDLVTDRWCGIRSMVAECRYGDADNGFLPAGTCERWIPFQLVGRGSSFDRQTHFPKSPTRLLHTLGRWKLGSRARSASGSIRSSLIRSTVDARRLQ